MTNSENIISLSGNWHYPTNILFGAGRISELPTLCAILDIKRPLLVTDKGLSATKFVQAAVRSNQKSNINTLIFDAIKANPTGTNIQSGSDVYKSNRCDGVIAFGGGSALDAGKAIAFMVGQTQSLWAFEDIADNWKHANTNAIAAVIAIPTTAGTGSEVGRASVIVDENDQRKKIIFHPKILPVYVIADPQLTVSLPAPLTAATGLDAFIHNFEAYCSPAYHPMADGIACEGMRLIKQYLPIAFHHGANLNARGNMLAASTMGATAFQKGLGAIHALAHPLGAIYDAHHGLLNAILFPYVLVQNKPAIEKKISTLARILEFQDTSFDGFLQWVIAFRQLLKIPNCLGEIGIDTKQAKAIGQLAVQDPSANGNPIAFTAEQYSFIFENAVNGRIT